jgi:hypothetical protein
MVLQQGYRVLLPDSRAHGESGGTLATYGLVERDDIHRWTGSTTTGIRLACTASVNRWGLRWCFNRSPLKGDFAR